MNQEGGNEKTQYLAAGEARRAVAQLLQTKKEKKKEKDLWQFWIFSRENSDFCSHRTTPSFFLYFLYFLNIFYYARDWGTADRMKIMCIDKVILKLLTLPR